MKANCFCLPLIMCCPLASACAGPAAPSETGFAGQWSGTTIHGRPIAFTVSSEEAVTAITLGHDFNGCSGSETFSDLRIPIAPNVICVPGPCSGSLSSYRAFGYTSRGPIDGPSTSLNALFLSTTRAEGTANFRNYPGCGDAIGAAWTASRR